MKENINVVIHYISEYNQQEIGRDVYRLSDIAYMKIETTTIGFLLRITFQDRTRKFFKPDSVVIEYKDATQDDLTIFSP